MRLRRLPPAPLLVTLLVPPLAGFILLLTSACAVPARSVPPARSGSPDVLDARGTFTLPNGMQILLVEAPSPLVASLVLVKTGSSDETEANAGVSHLLEHVLFDGTARRSKEELFREVYGMGGYLNGFTAEEYTGFILMAHPDFLDKILDIQADILFHSLFDAAKLEVTKGVVIEEIRQALTSPSSREADLHKARLYRGTTYAHPVLGSEQVIRRLSRDEILAYYRARYVPNNMVIVLIGPVGKRKALAKILKAFGAEAAQPLAPPSGVLPAPPGRAEVYVEETPATRKKLLLSVSVRETERDRYPAWEVLAALLDDRLQQAKDRPDAPRILSLGAGFSLGKRFALLEVTGSFPRETNEAEVPRLVDREMVLLVAGPIESAAVARVRKSLLGEEVRLAERIHYYAMEKAGRILALGTAGVRSYGEHIDRTQPEDVAAVARSLAEDLLFRTLLPDHPLAKPIYGTATSVGSISRDRLLALKDRYLTASNMIVSIVGGLPGQSVLAAAGGALGRIPRGELAPAAPALPATRGVREVREHLGKPQAQLLLGKVLPPADPRERAALEIAGSILSARLFGMLPEQEGLAYSVDAGVSFPQESTLLLIGMGTAPQNIDAAKRGILRELKNVVETPPTKEEVERRANGLAGRLAMRMLSSINRAYYLGVADFRDLIHGYGEANRKELLSVTPEEVSAVLRKYFGQEDYVLAIVD
ncbi:MAG: insulinase family protein [Candidatus Methylomirabilota bacterium]|jgi:predicted Zn-dependent peptidase